MNPSPEKIENPKDYEEYFQTLSTKYFSSVDDNRLPVIKDFWEYRDHIINRIISGDIKLILAYWSLLSPIKLK